MKKFVLLLSFCINVLLLVAQPNPIEAKAAYLLAEEEFNAGKYENCIKYLEDAALKMGSVNAKILYLKVSALQALAQKDEKQSSRLKEAINAFENASDINDFNEEKVLEITKLKLRLLKDGNIIIPEADMSDIFAKYQPDGWRLGTSLEQMKVMKPNFFAKASSGFTLSGTDTIRSFTLFDQMGMTIVAFKKNKLNNITISASPSDEKKDFSRGNQLVTSWLTWFSGTPVQTVTTSSQKGTESTITTYDWNDGKVKAILSYTKYVFNYGVISGKAYSSNIVTIVQVQ